MNVKICGIQTIGTALYAEENGADFIGFVFAPSSRRLSIAQAATIAGGLQGKARKVGVFVDETVENMINIAKAVQLDYIQLHGNESPEVAKALPFPVIKAFSIGKNAEEIQNYPCDYLLIDSPGTTYEGGSGKIFDWSKLENINFDRSKFILAGGLRPANVRNAIDAAHPIGVDVSSGVETNGQKDRTKIEQFIRAAKKEQKG